MPPGLRRATCAALGLPRSTFYRRAKPPTPAPRPRPQPRALTDAERSQVLVALHEDRFVDLAPAEVYATLLDEGVYLCSIYRILTQLPELTACCERSVISATAVATPRPRRPCPHNVRPPAGADVAVRRCLLLEGINNMIKVGKRNSYGFRDDAYFFLKDQGCLPRSSTMNLLIAANGRLVYILCES